MSSGSAPIPRCGRRERRPCRRCGRGRPPKELRRDGGHPPVSVKRLAHELPAEASHNIAGRQGSADWLASRFARVRACPSHRDTWRAAPRAEEWLLIEWPQGEPEPIKYWLSTMPEDITFDRLVDLAKLRWRIERDYQELKQELGFGDYEGRGWRGFHHHATLCIAAYGFLIAERGALPPSGPSGTPPLSASNPPCDYRPKGAADPARQTRTKLDWHPVRRRLIVALAWHLPRCPCCIRPIRQIRNIPDCCGST